MGILDDDVARVRESTDLVALVGEYTSVKRVGRQFMARCPFHGEKTPSLSINNELGVFMCFGCQARGDAITFIREIEHLDFVEAVERLAARASISLRYDDASFSKERQRKDRLHEAVGLAIAFYHERLLTADDAGAARKYLRGRGFDGDAARQFQLGYAPDGFEVLFRHLRDQKLSEQDIADAGLAFRNRARRMQDQFRGRLLFPIHDHRGQPVGFGGRALADGQGPKYKNTPETAIYHKSRVLFFLHEAKSEIVARRDVVVCEGYTDVMAFVLAGHPNAVATCGTALTDEHFQALRNLSPSITLAYDADAAGQAAAERCYQWEQGSEVQFRIADLPAGTDPADAWQADPEALTRALDGAAPFLQFRLDRLLAAADSSSIEGRARAAERGAALIAEHPSVLVRDQYAMKLAAELRLDTERVRESVEHASTRDRSAPPHGRRRGEAEPPAGVMGESPGPSMRAVDRRELDALRWAIHEPALSAGRLDRALFGDPLARATYDALAGAQTFEEARAGASPEVVAVLEQLAVEDPGDEEEAETLVQRTVINLVEASARRARASMLQQGNERVGELTSMYDALRNHSQSESWDDAEAVASRLVTWLAGQSEDVT
jgi:DNA primase